MSFSIGCSSPGPTKAKSDSGPPTETARLDDAEPQIVILYLSDLHGHLRPDHLPDGKELGGYARVAAWIQSVKAKAGPKTDVIAIAGGDTMGKSALPCRKTGEKACMPLLKSMGFDLALIGNGELKRSASELNELIQLSGLPWIGTNVKSKGPKPAWVETYSYKGPRSGAELFFGGWTIAPSPGEIDLKKAKLDIVAHPLPADFERWGHESAGRPVVWLTHQELQSDKEFLLRACESTSLKSMVLFKANDHQQLEDRTLCAPLFEPGAFGHYASQAVFKKTNDKGWTLTSHEFVPIGTSWGEEANLKATIDALYKTYAPDADQVVATAQHALTDHDFAQWLANAYKAVSHADVAIVNMGAVKSGVEPGPLTKEELSMVHPYGDELMGLDWNPKDMERALCTSSRRQMDSFEDYGSELVLAGAKLENPGTPQCKLTGPRSGSYKVVMVRYLVKRSKRWLGKDVSPGSFRFAVTSDRAMDLAFKKSGGTL